MLLLRLRAMSVAPLELATGRGAWQRRLRSAVVAAATSEWAGPLAVTAAGGAVRFWRLTTPRSLVSDEFYYVPDAYGILRHGVEVNHQADAPALLLHGSTNILGTGGEFVAHPPLGKVMIAAGEWIFGLTPFGWRFAAAVVGTLAILMTARIARRMTGSTLLGCVAGLLMAADGLEFVMSRVAMLDIFLMFWILAAFGCLVLDRDQWLARIGRLRQAADDAAWPLLPHGVRWWRVLAGACLGLACATKWDGLWYLPAFACLAIGWDVTAIGRAGLARPVWTTLRRAARWVPCSFVLVPAVTYVASWSGWFGSTVGYDRDWAAQHGNHVLIWSAVDSFYHDTRDILHYGIALVGTPQSAPWTWLALTRPMTFYLQSTKACTGSRCRQQSVQQILAIGTPLIWWAAISALVVCLGWWLASRDWRAGAVVLAMLAGWLPWTWFAWHGNRVVYSFYAVAFEPFLILAITLCLSLLPRAARGRWRRISLAAIGIYVVAAVGNFAFLYPILTAASLSQSAWLARMWLPGWRL
jgi:dolichyl-phosphate-mannose-protein mannosyltransferase